RPAMPDETPPRPAAESRAAAEANGIEISANSATYNMAHPDPAVRRTGLRRLAVIAAAAHAMGTRLLTLCTGTLDPDNMWRRHPGNDSPEAWRTLIESMTGALEIAGKYDVELGVEPELANIVSSAERARRLIDELGSPRVRVIIDAANLFEISTLERQRAIVAAGIDLLAERISIAHAKDRTPDGRFTTAGRGVVDYKHYVERLKKAGFNGPMIAHGLAESEAVEVARFLREAGV
ncbi:MAG: sugar phosphate isomerase/epimerase, partial [Bryobacteraceae bacterium]|nr:sugar phosphate isomerase/epimerase [Bryobacteraceae bacterium]